MGKLYIIIPAYNEEENIEKCVNDWYPVITRCDTNGESRLVIINDGSKDNTFEKLKSLAAVATATDSVLSSMAGVSASSAT